MTLRAGRLLLAAALIYGSGAHWLLMQGAAWTGMVAARAGRGSISRALATTFDGLHPCRVCLLVRRGGDAAPRPAPSVPTADFALTVPSRPSAPAPVPEFAETAPPRPLFAPRVPPTPPPNGSSPA